ncbi:MAG: siderophore-interacting protein [Bifidobacteriaceae bacterium]|jgi:NADPH-dependent ferric siderophore reductase|nr:siderophore-interacting protein [Bifidobacteriaceae bacterium]
MGFADVRKISGLYTAEVVRTSRVTPHMVRVTLGGQDLTRLPQRGFDHWFRLFLPRPEGETDFSNIPARFDTAGYLKYLRTKADARPPIRNYTVRNHRPEAGEIDVDFVAHGDLGVAGPWAQRAQPGERVALIDQGCGFDPLADATSVVLVGDESALPAIAGILRDLDRAAQGLAIVEIPDDADRQPVDPPPGLEVHWVPRKDPHARPGLAALAEARTHTPPEPSTAQAYLAGEQHLVAEARRHLVAARVPKPRIAFTGYWKAGHGQPR